MKQAVPLNRYVVYFSLVIAVCAADLGSKSWMFARLGSPRPPTESPTKPEWLWDGVFGFQTNLNEGALFGMGQGLWPLFAALSIAAAIAIVIWLFPAGAARDWLLTIALGFVTGGILGNFYDRVGLPGLQWPAGWPAHAANAPVHAVRDFILVMIHDWPWPTFNLADSALVTGAILLIGHAFFAKTDVGQCDSSHTEAAQD